MALSFLSNPSVNDAVDICFRCIDLNNDGSITKGELREVMLMNAKLKKYIEISRRNGSLDNVKLSPTETNDTIHEAEMIFEQMDRDRGGNITKDEFIACMEGDAELKARIQTLVMADETKNLFMKK